MRSECAMGALGALAVVCLAAGDSPYLDATAAGTGALLWRFAMMTLM